MKISPQAKLFFGVNKGDKKIRTFIKKGGRTKVLSDFNKLLVRASKLVTVSR